MIKPVMLYFKENTFQGKWLGKLNEEDKKNCL